jgi:hypothetical protein
VVLELLIYYRTTFDFFQFWSSRVTHNVVDIFDY